METFGQYFKSVREKSGLGIDELAEITRIGKNVILGLENDDPTFLPHETFLRGFLRSLAREMKINPDEMVSNYDSFRRKAAEIEFVQSQEKAKKKNVKKPTSSETGKKQSSGQGSTARSSSGSDHIGKKSSAGTIIKVIAVVSAVVAAFVYYEMRPVGEPVGKVHLDDIGHITDNQPGNLPNEAGRAEAVTATTSRENDEPASPSQKPATDLPNKPAVNQPAVNQPTGVVTSSGPAGRELGELKITAGDQSSWIGYEIDDEPIREATLNPGQSFIIKGSKTFKIQVGNAGAISLRLNGKQLGPLGETGEVRELQLKALPDKKSAQ